jgi:tetratricopeptide (TPR) repeat protein
LSPHALTPAGKGLDVSPGDRPVPGPVPRRRARRLLRTLLFLPLLIGLVLGVSWAWQWYRARQEWRQAQEALQRYDLLTAAARLGRYLEHAPRDPAAWFQAARTARRLGRLDEAQRLLERCQECGGVTEATRLEWDLVRVQQGDLGDVDVRLRLTIGPNHPDALLVLEALVLGYLQAERLPDALQACQFGERLDPKAPWPLVCRVWIYERMSQWERALETAQRAVALAPEDREAHLALGRLWYRHALPGAAAEQFEYVLAHWPDDEGALLGLAECRIDQGRTDEAIVLLDRVLAANPSSSSALFFRGKAALVQDNPAAAEGYLRQAVQLAPDDADALYLLVTCLRARGQEAEAGPLAVRVEELRNAVLRLYALIWATANGPDEAGPRHDAGVLCLQIGRQKEGLRWLQSALHAKGDHRPTHAVLAEYYLHHGDRARAETHRRQAESP